MSDFFMNDRYRVLQCMAQRQIIVNNEVIIKLKDFKEAVSDHCQEMGYI